MRISDWSSDVCSSDLEVPIVDGGVDSSAWRKMLPGLWFYDPALMTTAATSSAITELDGENGILRYRGYPIEPLAETSRYLEVAYLLTHGELPTNEQYEPWVHDITYHTFIHENVRKRFLSSEESREGHECVSTCGSRWSQ